MVCEHSIAGAAVSNDVMTFVNTFVLSSEALASLLGLVQQGEWRRESFPSPPPSPEPPYHSKIQNWIRRLEKLITLDICSDWKPGILEILEDYNFR